MPALSRLGRFHTPFCIIAAFPAINWSSTSPWDHVTTDLEAEPLFTRSTQNCSAWTAAGESSCFRSAPAPQNQGSNCQEPSSVATAEKAMPYTPLPVSLAATSLTSAQVVGGLTPALFSIS